jgi:oligosaccharide 4-alpha-D-glucosyltransferase
MIDVIESTAQYSSEKLTLHYYTDADITESRSMMYDDDGESRSNLLRDNYEVLGFFAQRDDHSLTIFLRRDGGEYDGKPDERELTLVVHNWASAPDRLLFDDTEISISGRLPRRGPGAAFDAKTRRLTVRVTWDHAPMSLQID